MSAGARRILPLEGHRIRVMLSNGDVKRYTISTAMAEQYRLRDEEIARLRRQVDVLTDAHATGRIVRVHELESISEVLDYVAEHVCAEAPGDCDGECIPCQARDLRASLIDREAEAAS